MLYKGIVTTDINEGLKVVIGAMNYDATKWKIYGPFCGCEKFTQWASGGKSKETPQKFDEYTKHGPKEITVSLVAMYYPKANDWVLVNEQLLILRDVEWQLIGCTIEDSTCSGVGEFICSSFDLVPVECDEPICVGS